MLTWLRVLLCVVGASLAVMACGTKGPEYPEDHARYKRIDQAVQSLRAAYSSKDLSAVSSLLLPGDTNDRVEQDIQKDFQHFAEITVDFAVDRIVIEGDTIDVFLHWQGHWKRNKDEMGIRERGHGVLRWVGVQSILLQSVEGDLPFGMASRQVEPPGGRRPS